MDRYVGIPGAVFSVRGIPRSVSVILIFFQLSLGPTTPRGSAPWVSRWFPTSIAPRSGWQKSLENAPPNMKDVSHLSYSFDNFSGLALGANQYTESLSLRSFIRGPAMYTLSVVQLCIYLYLWSSYVYFICGL